MRRPLLLVIAAVCGSACAAADEAPGAGPSRSAAESADVTRAFADPSAGPADDDICSHLPADGPCALACDPDALVAEYIPAGTCESFACTLDDGREVSVHACHAPD